MLIVLIGFMGAGKTTVGRVLSDRLRVGFVDTDELIQQRQGRPIRAIFDDEGEAHFREIEHATVAELARGFLPEHGALRAPGALSEHRADAVIAVGGGAVEDPRTRAVLRAATVVYLSVQLDEAVIRVREDGLRPMLRHPRLGELFEQRQAGYRDLATVTVATDGRGTADIVTDIISQLPDPSDESV